MAITISAFAGGGCQKKMEWYLHLRADFLMNLNLNLNLNLTHLPSILNARTRNLSLFTCAYQTPSSPWLSCKISVVLGRLFYR